MALPPPPPSPPPSHPLHWLGFGFSNQKYQLYEKKISKEMYSERGQLLVIFFFKGHFILFFIIIKNRFPLCIVLIIHLPIFVDSCFLVNRKVVIHLQFKCIHPPPFSVELESVLFIHYILLRTYLPTALSQPNWLPLVCTLPFPSHAPIFLILF
jgi:hypothetical protein